MKMAQRVRACRRDGWLELGDRRFWCRPPSFYFLFQDEMLYIEFLAEELLALGNFVVPLGQLCRI